MSFFQSSTKAAAFRLSLKLLSLYCLWPFCWLNVETTKGEASLHIHFEISGEYSHFDESQLTCDSGGKPKVMQYLKDTHNYKGLIHIGDGMTDWEACPPAVCTIIRWYRGTPFERPPWREATPSGKANWQCKSKHKCIDFHPLREATPIERPLFWCKKGGLYKRGSTVYTTTRDYSVFQTFRLSWFYDLLNQLQY